MITNTTNNTYTVFVCAGSGVPLNPAGPFGWCARIIALDGVYELAGASGDVSFSRLYTVGMVAALDALPEGNEVHIVCSDYNAISRFGTAADMAAGRNRRRWKDRPEAILALCRALHQAIQRHAKVTTQIIPQDQACEEQIEAQRRVSHVIDEFLAEADFGVPAPDRSKLRMVRAARPETEDVDTDNEESRFGSAGQLVASQQETLDVPW